MPQPRPRLHLPQLDAAQKLKHPQQTMDRLPGNLAAVSPEKAAKLPYRYLEEDCFQVGWACYSLIQQLPHDPATGGELRARVKPLLDRATSRPTMQATLRRFGLEIRFNFAQPSCHCSMCAFVGFSNVFVFWKPKTLEKPIKNHKNHNFQTISRWWCRAWR